MSVRDGMRLESNCEDLEWPSCESRDKFNDARDTSTDELADFISN
jgi:hypothetical protein